jgi:hypothetical protein
MGIDFGDLISDRHKWFTTIGDRDILIWFQLKISPKNKKAIAAPTQDFGFFWQ